MKTYNLCLLGFGNVGRALAKLLQTKSAELRARYSITWQLTGVATRRMGWIAASDGLDVSALLAGEISSPTTSSSVRNWLNAAHADVLFEITSLNAETGQPAIDNLRTALDNGVHAITANKGPIVHAYRELRDLATAKGKQFMFESTVMDGAPIFSLFRDALPATNVLRFRGILNSTTNYILTEMEAGLSFEEAVHKAQSIGIAETDPSADIDGWDAAVKVAALATVLMDIPLKLENIDRRGIRGLSAQEVRAARAAGHPYKLVCRAERVFDEGKLHIESTIRPEQVALTDPLASVGGTSSLVHFETDTLAGLTITEHNPGPDTTAYGLLADFINAVRAER